MLNDPPRDGRAVCRSLVMTIFNKVFQHPVIKIRHTTLIGRWRALRRAGSKWGVMLKISIEKSSNQVTTVRPEGQIAGRWVESLRKACEGELNDHKRLIVDLADVSFVDRHGITLLTQLRTRQVVLASPQPFVAELLKPKEDI
jgi:anti-anti-sigma regulatory factor